MVGFSLALEIQGKICSDRVRTLRTSYPRDRSSRTAPNAPYTNEIVLVAFHTDKLEIYQQKSAGSMARFSTEAKPKGNICSDPVRTLRTSCPRERRSRTAPNAPYTFEIVLVAFHTDKLEIYHRALNLKIGGILGRGRGGLRLRILGKFPV